MQVRLDGKFLENLNYYGIERSSKASLDSTNGTPNTDLADEGEVDLDTDGHEADLTSGNKETCILEASKNLSILKTPFSLTSIMMIYFSESRHFLFC